MNFVKVDVVSLNNTIYLLHPFNFADATVNRNSDRENGTIYPVTPTKELNSDFSTSKHVSLIALKYALSIWTKS